MRATVWPIAVHYTVPDQSRPAAHATAHATRVVHRQCPLRNTGRHPYWPESAGVNIGPWRWHHPGPAGRSGLWTTHGAVVGSFFDYAIPEPNMSSLCGRLEARALEKHKFRAPSWEGPRVPASHHLFRDRAPHHLVFTPATTYLALETVRTYARLAHAVQPCRPSRI